MIQDTVKALLKGIQDPVVVELGAYDGSDTRWLRESCEGSAPYYIAVEPDARHFPGLLTIPGIRAVQVAIASYTGMAPWYASSDDLGTGDASSSIRPPKEHLITAPQLRFTLTGDVPCLTLDDLATREGIERIDVLWADIQGAEKDMVQGGKNILRRTEWVLVESCFQELYEGQAVRREFLEMVAPDFELIAELPDETVLLKHKVNTDIPGWMTPEELGWLHATARTMNSAVEVGCWKGRSTHALLSGCHGPVYAVDHWLGTPSQRSDCHSEANEGRLFQDFCTNVGMFSNLTVVRGESPGVATMCPDAEMVFLDGDHGYGAVKADLEAWGPKTKRLICGHDIESAEVRRAVEETFGRFTVPAGQIWAVEVGG